MRYVGNHTTLNKMVLPEADIKVKVPLILFCWFVAIAESGKESPLVFERKKVFLPNQWVSLDIPLLCKWSNLPGPQRSHEVEKVLRMLYK